MNQWKQKEGSCISYAAFLRCVRLGYFRVLCGEMQVRILSSKLEVRALSPEAAEEQLSDITVAYAVNV